MYTDHCEAFCFKRCSSFVGHLGVSGQKLWLYEYGCVFVYTHSCTTTYQNINLYNFNKVLYLGKEIQLFKFNKIIICY